MAQRVGETSEVDDAASGRGAFRGGESNHHTSPYKYDGLCAVMRCMIYTYLYIFIAILVFIVIRLDYK